ncbi:GNAT family N-acetyltransferase [Stratiformator vulcanicus]|uniref:N-acetyltransferase domain-containing protein n=1 Tax=Stratiformator vulcanicus TaxID=2527980 RepID=A0A517QXP0_9PLAN|nr:GNAT family N-acetyltransferase [Stratiformator vulcanicus]QDT36340.1 hypothetical protein Pan189_06960 [Stratiformator vulcanicus]
MAFSPKRVYEMELSHLGELVPRRSDDQRLRVGVLDPPLPALNRFLFTLIGADYGWSHREHWRRKQWESFAASDEITALVGTVGHTPIAYAELEAQTDDSLRILTLGLVPEFIGRGYGGTFLTDVVEYAFSTNPQRLWLTTCDRDHPHALSNYQARGFRIIGEMTGPPNPKAKSFWDWK